MHLPEPLLIAISKISPAIGALLGGPAGSAVGSLVGSFLGVDMNKPDEVMKKLTEDPEAAASLKSLELHLKDLHDARDEASKETGIMRWLRPLLVVFAFVALFADVLMIAYINNEAVRQILLVMMGILVFDIKQIYRFYFGSGEDVSAFLPFSRKK